MDASEVKAIVDRNIVQAMRDVGVPHWRVEVEYGDTGHPNWAAKCDRAGAAYWHATITLNPAAIENTRYVLVCLYHEIAHLLLAPFDLYRNTLTAGFSPDSKRGRQEQFLWTSTIEGCVVALERGLLADHIDAAMKREKKVKRA